MLKLGSARKIWESFPPHTEQLLYHELLLGIVGIALAEPHSSVGIIGSRGSVGLEQPIRCWYSARLTFRPIRGWYSARTYDFKKERGF
ncbi:hypothetical protein ElyMa_005715900 [Elysia marginata]|uniref:Uncharacterized protein n=1 Tax=Elysia marginata TaxID=1093978 RepID=A0AAV4FKH9_9GAST|nr:hypothetical protein ElyMa_005715900 [Elysia marginata]